MIIIIPIISFLLDGIISILVTPNSILFPLFTLSSILIIYKFKLPDITYLISCALIGLIYGITYNNLLLDMGLFMIGGLLILMTYQRIKISALSEPILLVFMIVLYRTLTYLVLLLMGYKLSIYILLKGMYSSLLLNIIYVLLVNYLIHKLNNRLNCPNSKII